MKIRIKGNTVRLRLSKSEVAFFEKEKTIAEETDFGNAVFKYSLTASDSITQIGASFHNNSITISIPLAEAVTWATTNKVGLSNEVSIGNGKKLYLLIEKDFKCLDETIEDQSDNYDNPLVVK